MAQHPSYPYHMPSWVWPLLINAGVILVTAGVSYGLLKGEVATVDGAQQVQQQSISNLQVRIETLTKEQDRVVRLEENLKNIEFLLQEIRTDLRSGRYATPQTLSRQQ